MLKRDAMLDEFCRFVRSRGGYDEFRNWFVINGLRVGGPEYQYVRRSLRDGKVECFRLVRNPCWGHSEVISVAGWIDRLKWFMDICWDEDLPQWISL